VGGQNGAGNTTLAKLLCRLYDPQSGAIEVDGVDLRDRAVTSWRARVAAVLQDVTRHELPLRDHVAPAGAPDDVARHAVPPADGVCVVEKGRVVELGTHDELIALGGRYRTMFDLQAERFTADEEGVTYDVLA